MTRFVDTSDGVAIACDIVGEGPPVVLIHGFGASRIVTWRNTNWYEWLTKAGRQAIAIDCRGHGESGKPHNVAAYHDRRLAADVVEVLDALNIERADIAGYSMGGFIAVNVLRRAPERIGRAVLAGVGENYFSFWAERNEAIAQGLLAADPETIVDPVAREFRAFCERAGNDLVALAACMRRERISPGVEELNDVRQPILVVCGEDDRVAGRPEPLARHFRHGRAVAIPRRNHHSTVGDGAHKRAVTEFLSE